MIGITTDRIRACPNALLLCWQQLREIDKRDSTSIEQVKEVCSNSIRDVGDN